MVELIVLLLFFAWLHPASEHREEIKDVADHNLYVSTFIIAALMVWAGIKGVPLPFVLIFGGLALILPWVAFFTGVTTRSRNTEQALNWVGLIIFTFFAVASMFA